MTDIFDDKMSLSEFKQLYEASSDTKDAVLSEMHTKYLQQEASSSYWKNEKAQIENRITYYENKKNNLIAELSPKNIQSEEIQKAETFFKNYQKITLNGIIAASHDEQSGTQMATEVHKAVQKALQTGNFAQLNQDIEAVKKQYNKNQSVFTKIFNRKKNKQLENTLNKAVEFAKTQKEKIDANPILYEKFCGDTKTFNQQKEKLLQDINTLNDNVQSIDKNIQTAQSELSQINAKIEQNVSTRIDKISQIPEVSLSAEKINQIVIEDEANIKQSASFNMNFIQEGGEGRDGNIDIAKAQKAAKLIAAAGFSITDNPEEAKNTGSFYLKKGEIFTPFIAKEDLPKYKALLAMLEEHNAAPTNLNIPTQPEQILREKPEPQNIDVAALVSEAAQKGIHGIDYGPGAEIAIQEKYNNKDYLYRGTMSADATYVGSGRSGRQGIIYATDQVVNAAAYSGSKSQYGAGLSGTGDKYADNEITYIKDGKETKGYIGCIHVYENQNNKMYNNWEIENKTYTGGDKNYETFLKSDNKHVATYLTISTADGREIDTVFEIPRDDPRWQAFIKSRGIDPALTYQNGREELLERMQAQLQEVKQNGQVKTASFVSMKTSTSEQEWQKAAEQTKEKSPQKQEAEKPAKQDKAEKKVEKTATTPSKDDKARIAELSGRTGQTKPTAKAQDDAAKTQDTPTKTQDGKADIRPDAELKFATPMQTSDLPPAPVVVQAPSQDEYDKFAAKDADSKLRKVCEDLRGKDEKLYTQVVTEWNRQYYENPPKDIEQSDNIAKNVMMQYKKDLEPLVVDQIQKDITPQNTANVDATKLDQAKDDLQQKDPTARAEAVAELNKHAENPVNITDAPQQTAFKEQTSQQQGEKVNAMRHGHNLDLEKSANYVPNTITASARSAPQKQQTNTAAFNLAQATKTADTGRGSY